MGTVLIGFFGIRDFWETESGKVVKSTRSIPADLLTKYHNSDKVMIMSRVIIGGPYDSY